jgi:ketosteroid isomerase-like protein
MSRENVETFLKGVEAVNRDDWSTVIGLMDPEVVFMAQRTPVQGSYVGHDAVRLFVQDTRDTFEVFQCHYVDIRDLEDHVLALGTLRIRGKGSGIETEVPSGVLARFRAGMIIHYQDFGDRQRVLKAAGLAD